MRPAEGSGIWPDAIGRAAYLVGWTKPLRRALGGIGKVGGGGSTARKGNDDAGGIRSGFEGVPGATADLERGGAGLQEPQRPVGAKAGRDRGSTGKARRSGRALDQFGWRVAHEVSV